MTFDNFFVIFFFSGQRGWIQTASSYQDVSTIKDFKMESMWFYVHYQTLHILYKSGMQLIFHFVTLSRTSGSQHGSCYDEIPAHQTSCSTTTTTSTSSHPNQTSESNNVPNSVQSNLTDIANLAEEIHNSGDEPTVPYHTMSADGLQVCLEHLFCLRPCAAGRSLFYQFLPS